ncbi:MAG: hypothetical protein R3C03_09470 [Pirellulaceae bacterium]
MEEASQSLDKVCRSCKKCSNCNKPGGSSGSSSGGGNGSSKQGDPKPGEAKPGESKQDGKPTKSSNPTSKQQQPDSDKLAATTEKAHQVAKRPSPNQTKELSQELNQLADETAQKAGYPNRKAKPQNGQPGQRNSSDSSKPASAPQSGSPSKPQGVQGNAGAGQSEVAPTELRGRSTSNWTQSRRKLRNNVLDDQDAKVPEEFRNVVKDYFEELSRLESRQNKPEKQE